MSDEARVDGLMAMMESDWRYRWCTAAACACLGCANGSGRLSLKGVTREQWEAWVKRNDRRQGPNDRRGAR